MRRIQLHLDEEMDAELAAEAARRGMSKAALIRQLLEERRLTTAHADPIEAIIGTGDAEPTDDIDAVIYRVG